MKGINFMLANDITIALPKDKAVPVSERKPIRRIICSYGGDLDINNLPVSLIRLSKTPINSYFPKPAKQ